MPEPLTVARRAEILDYAERLRGGQLGDMFAALLAENERLTAQLQECWGLLTLTTIPMEIGPGAERLLRQHGRWK